jgi:hypothetical protein
MFDSGITEFFAVEFTRGDDGARTRETLAGLL